MTAHETTTPSAPVDGAAFADEWGRWHDAHEDRRADPHGFLAVTGLHVLDATPTAIAGAPGRWSTSDDGPVGELSDADGRVELGGVALTGRHAFGPIPERGGVDVVWGDAVVEVARRGGRDLVRPRHPDNALRTAYRGTPTYVPNPRWAVRGRFVPFDVPRPTTVGSAALGLEHVYEAPGRVEFELDGATHALTVFAGAGDGLLAVFTDETSGLTTYAANRSLSIAAPTADGDVVLDFNRAVNLPCAYTDHATCPLPPAGNRLEVAIEAGEKTPLERLGAAA